MPKKKAHTPEYSLNIFHHFDETVKHKMIVFLVQTTRIFVSFRYEILLEESIHDNQINVKIIGLHVPELLMPQSGPASGRINYENIQGTYKLNISKQDKTVNNFKIEILSEKIIIKQKPKEAFIIVSNEPVAFS